MTLDVTVSQTIDEQARQRYEKAWRDGRPPVLEEFLPSPDDPRYLATLEELIQIEMEFTWKSHPAGNADASTLDWKPLLVEKYVERFPQLNQPAILRRLLEQEYRVRQRYGDRPPARDYVARFPQVIADTEIEQWAKDSKPPPGVTAAPPEIPDYELLGELGRGAMGVVYKARQISLDRFVALKMILAGAHASPDQLTRFRTEAEAVAKLEHPNIVRVYEIGDQDGRPFFSLEFVSGGSLKDKLAGTPLPAAEAAQLIETLARALHSAHQHGIVHRDLKPANVLLSGDGTPKIADFGLAKRLEGGSGQTHTGAILGTPSYMAPEQARGDIRNVGAAADVFSLGATLYETLTGRPPFMAATPWDTILQVIGNDPVSPSALHPKVPRDLETICLKCLEKEPARRYPSALAVAEDLRRFINGEPIRARPASAFERMVKWARRRPAVASLATAVIIVTLAGFAGVTAAWRKAEERREQLAVALADTQMREYFLRLGLADQEWQANHVPRMQALLDECPAQLRDWEWHYLRRLGRTERLSFSGSGPLVFAAGGKHIVSARGNSIEVRDARNGEVLQTLTGHSAKVTTLALSGDAALLASGSDDETVRIWDIASGKCVRTIAELEDSVAGVALRPDGKQVASAAGRVVRVNDVDTGKEVRLFQGHTGMVTRIAFSSDGKQLASASRDETVKVWDAYDGRELHTLRGHAGPVTGLGFSADGRRLASGGVDQIVRLWDPATGKELQALRGPSAAINDVAFSGDGRWLGVASGDVLQPGELLIWDAKTGKEARIVRGHSRGAAALTFSPDGELVAAADDQTVKLWPASVDQQSRALHGHAGGVTAVAFRPDGKCLASSGADGMLRLWDPDAAKPLHSRTAPAKLITTLAFSPDGSLLAYAADNGLLRLADPVSGEDVRPLAGNAAYITSLAFSRDGRWLASAGGDWGQPGEIKLWDVANGAAAQSFKGHGNRVSSVIFNADGRRLISASADQTIKIWDVATGREVLSISREGTPDAVLALHPDGRSFASAGGNISQGEITFWDSATGQKLRTLSGHTGRIAAIAFSPDGRRLVSAGWDQTLKLWDTATGQELLTLRGHTAHITGVAFSADGHRIASAGWDETVRIWGGIPIENAK